MILNCTQWIREAGEMALKFYESPEMSLKGTQDYLSQADRSIEDFLITKIKTHFPRQSILAEESGGTIKESGFIIDPLDGTENFLRKIPMFGICLSYIENFQTLFSLTFNPVTNELFFAKKNGGAFLNDQKIFVSKSTDFDKSCICLGHSYRTDNKQLYRIKGHLINQKVSLRMTGSGAIGLAYVASGRYDAFMEEHLQVWDLIHGKLLIEEAGGKYYPIDIKETLENGACGIAANNELKEKIFHLYEETK